MTLRAITMMVCDDRLCSASITGMTAKMVSTKATDEGWFYVPVFSGRNRQTIFHYCPLHPPILDKPQP